MSEYIPKLRRPLRNSSVYNSESNRVSDNDSRYNRSSSSRVSESDPKKRLRFTDDNNISSTQTDIEKNRRKNSAAEFLKSKENTAYLSSNISNYNNYNNMSRSTSSGSSSRINRYTPQLSDITSNTERTSMNSIHRARVNEVNNNTNNINKKYDSLNTAPIRRLNNSIPINSRRILKNDTNRIRQLNNSRINKPLINRNNHVNTNSSLSRSILNSLSNVGSKLFNSLLVTEPSEEAKTSTGLASGHTGNTNSNIKYEVDTTIKNKLPLPYSGQRPPTNQLPLIPQTGSNGQTGYDGQKGYNEQSVYDRQPVYRQEAQYQTQYQSQPQQQPQPQYYDTNNNNPPTGSFNPRSISSSTVSSFGNMVNPEFSIGHSHSIAPTSLSSNMENPSNLIDRNQQITVNLPETTQFILEQVKDLRIELQEMKLARERDSRKYESEREEFRIEKELKINELDIKCRQLEKENDNLLTILKDKDRDILNLQEANDKMKKNLRVLRLLSEQKVGDYDDEDDNDDDDGGNEYDDGEGNTGRVKSKDNYDIDDEDFDYIQLLTRYGGGNSRNGGVGGGLRNSGKRRRLKNMKKPVQFKDSNLNSLIESERKHNNDSNDDDDDKPSNSQTVDDKLKNKIKNMEMKLSNLNSKLEDQVNQAREIKNEINKS